MGELCLDWGAGCGLGILLRMHSWVDSGLDGNEVGREFLSVVFFLVEIRDTRSL